MRWVAASVAMTCVVVASGCRSSKTPARATEAHAPLGNISVASDTGIATKAPAADAEAGGARARPLLVAGLAGRRAAILLDDEAPPKATGTRPTVLERGPVATAAVDLPETMMSATARARLAKVYRLGGVRDPSADCSGRLERIVDLARIVAYDPVMGEEKLSDLDLADRVFANGVHSVAAVVELAPSCSAAVWAVPDGHPRPTPLPTARLDPRTTEKLESWFASSSESYRALPTEAEWTRRFEATRLGTDRAWVMALRAQPGSPIMLCALVDLGSSSPKVIAEASMCPESLAGATEHAGSVVLWFDHAMARVEGTRLELTYFPTASFTPYGAF